MHVLNGNFYTFYIQCVKKNYINILIFQSTHIHLNYGNLSREKYETKLYLYQLIHQIFNLKKKL